jgi:hypothetical protein
MNLTKSLAVTAALSVRFMDDQETIKIKLQKQAPANKKITRG